MTSEGFDIFATQDRKVWEEKATKDLKSLVLESLKWELPACGEQPPLLFDPIYFDEDIENGTIEVIKGRKGWVCGEKVDGMDKNQLLDNLLKSKKAGVDAPIIEENEEKAKFVAKILPDDVTLFLKDKQYSDELLQEGASKSIVFLVDTVDEMITLNARSIALNAHLQTGFTSKSNSGSDLCLNILEQSKKFNEFIQKNGADPLPKTVYIPMVIGLDYFPSIAALRALRIILANILGAYGKSLDNMPLIDTYIDPKGYTEDDPYINLIRGTVIAMAAVSGGSSRITLTPANSDQFFKSNSRNILHLMKHESFMGQVADPAAGSYYIDKMTEEIAERVWNSLDA